VESLISRSRAACLNEHWFLSLDDAQEKIEAWRQESNHHRPHSSSGYRSPEEFVAGSKIAETNIAWT
jgi:putative transposase